MSTLIVLVVIILLMPMVLILWNKKKTKGKLLCTMVKDDKSTDTRLCPLDGGFVIYKDRAYDVYPDVIRVTKYPSGWPSFLQELVPHALYDESNALPLDWINLSTDIKFRSMEVKAALDENFFKKIVQETVAQGKGLSLNMRKILPLGLGAIAILVVLYLVVF